MKIIVNRPASQSKFKRNFLVNECVGGGGGGGGGSGVGGGGGGGNNGCIGGGDTGNDGCIGGGADGCDNDFPNGVGSGCVDVDCLLSYSSTTPDFRCFFLLLSKFFKHHLEFPEFLFENFISTVGAFESSTPRC